MRKKHKNKWVGLSARETEGLDSAISTRCPQCLHKIWKTGKSCCYQVSQVLGCLHCLHKIWKIILLRCYQVGNLRSANSASFALAFQPPLTLQWTIFSCNTFLFLQGAVSLSFPRNSTWMLELPIFCQDSIKRLQWSSESIQVR